MKSPKPADSKKRGAQFRVAIIGAATLKGKEVKELLTERGFPAADVRLLDDEESLGQLDVVGDEPSFVQSVVPENLEGVDFAFFAAEQSFTAKTWEMARRAGCEIIDLSYALESRIDINIRAPWLEHELGEGHPVQLASAPVVVAHPVAAILALLLVRLSRHHKIRHVNATIFEPASEHGRRGMDELHDQTVNLLSFQQLPTVVYGTQVAFNVVPSYGEGVEPALASIEQRVLRHYRAIAGGHAPSPALMLLHAPVFHAYTFSIYIELQSAISQGDFEAALAGEHLEIVRTQQSEPSNLNASGQTRVQIAIRGDAQRETGFWIWAAADNLRIAASLAVEAAEDMAATRPRGQVQ
jgi:aspartate-semialdehyde dehydrogenase